MQERASTSARPASATSRDASLATLAIGLGHDIGNIVLPILCHLDSLESRKLSSDAMTDLRAVRESAIRLKRLSGGLSLFSHDPDDAGATVPVTLLRSWWLDVEPVLRKAIPSSITLRAEIAGEVPPVRIPPHQLTRVMLNLIVNAGEAISERGEVCVSMRALPENEHVEIRVTDSGRGMTEHVREHAMDPFFTTKTRHLSTGLGLSQVHSLIQSAGGTVSIDSQPGGGATVVLTLSADSSASHSPRAAKRAAFVRLSDERMAAYTRALLECAGFEIQNGAINGDDAHHDALWITDASVGAVEAARTFVHERPGRRAIVFGASSLQSDEPGLIWIEASHRALQRELQRATSASTG